MVPRYARPAMVAIWEPEARYKIWFEIEAHATQKLGELGVVPASGAQALWDWWATNPAIDVAAIDAIEAVTKHDVIAFLTWVAEQVGDQARFMHQGMTSSDVLDTCLAVQMAQAADILIADLDALLAALRAEGCEVMDETDTASGFGKFGWVIDPEGNKVEFWQPPEGQ